MRYFVLAEDGNKYGPADVDLLNEWIEEGRLLPGMNLEEEGTHVKVAAASVLGLDFMPREEREEPVVAQAATVDASGAMALLSDQPTIDTGRADVILAWAMSLVTVMLGAVPTNAGVLGLFTGILGIVAAFKAKDRRHGGAPLVLASAVLALIVWGAFRLVAMGR